MTALVTGGAGILNCPTPNGPGNLFIARHAI